MKYIYYLTRLLAAIIDYTWIIILLLLIYSMPLYTNSIDSLLNSLVVSIMLAMISPLIYQSIQAILITKYGSSIGKICCGLKIKKSNANLNIYQSLFRTFIGPIINSPVFGLGYIWIFIDEKHRGWHDLAIDSEVLVKNTKRIIFGIIMFIVQCIVISILLNQYINLITIHSDFYKTIFQDIYNSYQESSKNDTPSKKNSIPLEPIKIDKTTKGTQI